MVGEFDVKWNQVFILLCCGTTMGGVFAPIFLTDALGFTRMIEWFPADLGFDWGSFLGGSIAAIAAFILFMVQRHVDRKETRRRQLAKIRAFCIRSQAIVKVALNVQLKDREAEYALKNMRIGFHAAAVQMSEIADSVPDLSEEDLEVVRVETVRCLSTISHHVDRIGWHFDQVILGDEISEEVFTSMTDIAETLEKLRRLIVGCQSDAKTEYWGGAGVEFKKYVIRGPMRIVEALNKMDEEVSSLSKMLASN